MSAIDSGHRLDQVKNRLMSAFLSWCQAKRSRQYQLIADTMQRQDAQKAEALLLDLSHQLR